MDNDSKKILDSILAKRVESLTKEEGDILRARRSYLTRTQEQDFINILNQTAKATENKNEPPKTNKGRVSKK